MVDSGPFYLTHPDFVSPSLIDKRGQGELSCVLDSVAAPIYTKLCMVLIIKEPRSFQWDKGNIGKNLAKHGVSDVECEEVFSDKHKVIKEDTSHSKDEKRYIMLGVTKRGRLLYVVFTIREEAVRVISARTINKKEIKLYE